MISVKADMECEGGGGLAVVVIMRQQGVQGDN